jgi:hypothetical protein
MLQWLLQSKTLVFGTIALLTSSSFSPAYADQPMDTLQAAQTVQSQSATIQPWTGARCFYRRCRPLTIR